MKLKSLLAIALVPAMLTSCLKSRDSLGVLADEGSISTGIFDRFYYGELKSLALNALPAQETVDFVKIWYSAPKKKAGAITVTLQVDNSLVTAYNTAHGASLVTLPTAAYSFPSSLTITLPAGNSGEFVLPIRLDKSLLNLQNVYALGLKISSVSEGVVNLNEKDVLVSILVKNQYHGDYEATGYFYHPSAPRDQHLDKELLTVGPTSVTCDLGDLGASGYRAVFTVDPATNNVNIAIAPGAAGGSYTMFTSGLPSTNHGYAPAWPGSAQCNNTYNPATKTFYVRYGYLGGTGWRVTEEHITRL